MKITKVETAWISIKCDVPQEVSSGPIRASNDAVCRITTDDGLQGIGEGRGASLAEICRVINEVFTPLLVGCDPLQTQFIWSRMYEAAFGGNVDKEHPLEPRAVRAAIAAVDLALWDIKAKYADVSVCELLGGQPRPVLSYLSKGFYVQGQSLEEMVEEAVCEVNAGGYKHVKIRVGRGGAEDAATRVRLIRKAFGDSMRIMVDANQAWDYDTALEACAAMEPYGVDWVEEPLKKSNHATEKGILDWNEALGLLGTHTSIPTSAGENHVDLRDCRELVGKGKIKYMQYDAIKTGGVTEWMKVAALSEAYGVLMAPHHVAQFHVQLAAAVPNSYIVECYDYKRQHPSWPGMYIGFPDVVDGYMQFPKGTGWGLKINDPMMKKLATLVYWDA
jgi:L-alanine-DL-glutamate epimerase-like enolase superfamily enzyme